MPAHAPTPVHLQPGQGGLAAAVIVRLLSRGAAQRPDAVAALRGRRLRVEAEGMTATIIVEADHVDVAAGATGRADATLRGSLPVLLAAARGCPWRWLLTGRLRVSGRIWLLRHLQAWLRAGSRATP